MSDSRCLACGSMAGEEMFASIVIDHNGKSKSILDRRTVCPDCENVSYVGSQISEHELAVAAAIRDMDGLLSAEEIRRVRAKYHLKQTDMEQILSTGPKTWTRWERGKVPQSKSADKLIRLMAEHPDIAHTLMKQSGVRNEEATAVFEQIAANARSFARDSFELELGQVRPETDMQRFVDRAFTTIHDAWKQAAEAA